MFEVCAGIRKKKKEGGTEKGGGGGVKIHHFTFPGPAPELFYLKVEEDCPVAKCVAFESIRFSSLFDLQSVMFWKKSKRISPFKVIVQSRKKLSVGATQLLHED